MRRRRIYADTSAIGGCLDEEFRIASRRLFDRFEAGEDILGVSELTLEELRRAPSAVRDVLRGVDSRHVEELEFTLEAAELAEEYIDSGVVIETKRIDAQHVATATVHGVDVVVSWNFNHLVNFRNGYALLEIRTPREVLPYEER